MTETCKYIKYEIEKRSSLYQNFQERKDANLIQRFILESFHNYSKFLTQICFYDDEISHKHCFMSSSIKYVRSYGGRGVKPMRTPIV